MLVRVFVRSAILTSCFALSACAGVGVSPSSTVFASNFRAVPNPAQRGETVQFLWDIGQGSQQFVATRWTLEINGTVEGTGSRTGECGCTHSESVNSLITLYGTGDKSVKLRVYESESNRTVKEMSLSLTLKD